MEAKNLKGAAPQGTIGVVDGEGNIADPATAVFPILKQTIDRNFHLIGTGFFITDSGIFATAKHVLLDVIDDQGVQTHPIVLVQFFEGSFVIRPILRCASHTVADISVGMAAPMNHNTLGTPLKNKLLKLTQTVPAPGERVSTYAYPRSVITRGDVQELHFWPDFFEGRVQEHHPNGRDSVMMPGPCAQTSMYIHGGASGGPVFDSAGEVFAVNSTGLENDDVSFVTPIHMIENLYLDDVFTPTNKSGRVSIAELIDVGFIAYRKTI